MWVEQPLVAGRVIFDRTAPADRPAWVASLVSLCAPLVAPLTEVDALLALSPDPTRWKESHHAFGAIRQLTLREERRQRPAPTLMVSFLHLAENAAKVIYNASGAPAPFDADAGWWMAGSLRDIVDYIGDPAFETQAWRALIRDPGAPVT